MQSELSLILLGISFGLWCCTTIGVAYVIWRYVFTPWKTMRRDMMVLTQQQEANQKYFETVVKPRIDAFTDEELAMVERRLKERSRARTG